MNLRDSTLRHLAEEAERQGWTVEDSGSRLVWKSPDVSQGPVYSARRISQQGHQLPNLLADLRRHGLKVNGTGERDYGAEPVAVAPEPPERFVHDLAGLIEEELNRRTRNLTDQVVALQNENRDLRERLAEVQSDVEERARKTAMAAVENMLAERRVRR